MVKEINRWIGQRVALGSYFKYGGQGRPLWEGYSLAETKRIKRNQPWTLEKEYYRWASQSANILRLWERTGLRSSPRGTNKITALRVEWDEVRKKVRASWTKVNSCYSIPSAFRFCIANIRRKGKDTFCLICLFILIFVRFMILVHGTEPASYIPWKYVLINFYIRGECSN